MLILAAVVTLWNMWDLVLLLISVSEVADWWMATLLSNPVQGEEGLRDMARIFANTLSFMFLVSLGFFLFLFVRYIRLLWPGLRKAHPATHALIRRIAILQLAISLTTWFALAAVFTGLETMQVEPYLGLGSVVGGIILWLVTRRDLKEYFSAHEFVAAPMAAGTPPAPAPVEPETPA